MWKLHQVNVASKHFATREIEEHRVHRNAEIQWDIFEALKSSNLPDNIDKILSNVNKPWELHDKLSNKEFNILFDYLGVALGILDVTDEANQWYKQIIELDLGDRRETNCWYHPKMALFLAHIRALWISRKILKLIDEKTKWYGLSVAKHPERMVLISDEYLELMFNAVFWPFQCLDHITEYFGWDKRFYTSLNDLDINIVQKIIELFQYDHNQKFLKKIDPQSLLLLSDKHLQRLIDMSDSDMKIFFKQKKCDLLLSLCIEDDREFNKTLNWIKYDLYGPEHKWDTGLL